jgi:hypothetical protein
MAVRFEWQTGSNGRRRYVRIQDDTPDEPKLPSKRTRPAPVEVKAEAPKPKRGRPPKVKTDTEVLAAALVEEDTPDE